MKARLLLASALVAALLPATALAAKPPHPSQAKNTSHPAPQVLYVLRGTLTAYTAADGASNGTVTITVAGSNHWRAQLKGLSLSFPVSAKTKIVLHKGAPFAVNDRGIVKVRALKKLDTAALQQALAKQVIDQGAPAAS